MREMLDPLVQHSPFGGGLVAEQVAGTTSGALNPENDVQVSRGADRQMYVYVPSSGVPHAKQAQVLMVLGNASEKGDVDAELNRLCLTSLAEECHFVLVVPVPQEGGWNFSQDPSREDDLDFVVKCFAALKGSRGDVAGFNGMIFHLGVSPEGSAMTMTLAVERPLDAAAIMMGAFPEGYEIPAGHGAEQMAWLYEKNPAAESYLAYVDEGAPLARLFQSDEGLAADVVRDAWERMFQNTRRWRNDTFGTYRSRVDFVGRGFVAHVGDCSLGDNNNFMHTWYEYVPERLRDTTKPIPLVVYFHGINCVPLYGAEQSAWADLADRDGFMVCFPAPAIEERWNVWDDPRLPSDVDFVHALVAHMAEVHPLDEGRVYLSGFSMGSMFTNALACSEPYRYAGCVALNGPNMGYLQTLDQSLPGICMLNPHSVLGSIEPSDAAESPVHKRASSFSATDSCPVPFVQYVGLLDGVGFDRSRVWPVEEGECNMWVSTVGARLACEGVREALRTGADNMLGLSADEVRQHGRLTELSWKTPDGTEALYHLVGVARMPHAVDLTEIELGWEFVRQFRRNADGTLTRIEGK